MNEKTPSSGRDYRASVFLPRTEFPMKAALAQREPGILESWARADQFAQLRRAAKGRAKFILHDGPPYANGHLHIGHALNKILKDVINRSQQMLGRDANYVPGWDCHGLPIEWKIEEEYRAKGRDKDQVPPIEFRRECRDFAEKWIGVQAAEFKRLGILGNWDDPYTTMTFAAEAQIVRELGLFLMDGQLYRGEKAVMWSPVEKTALAEAEVEYRDKTSTTIWVRFPVVQSPIPALNGASIVIWTTTPWTIPSNRAVAYGADIEYVAMSVRAAADGSLATREEIVVVARALAEQVAKDAKIGHWVPVATFTGRELAGARCRHPLWKADKGYDFTVPLVPGHHVTTEQGTGFVHIAPSHGEEDFEIGLREGLEVVRSVAEDGTYYPNMPLFAGEHVFKVDAKVTAKLNEAGALLAQGKLTHSYPHSWRSKAPLIYRATPQWFISMEAEGLRQKALDAIDATQFYPEAGRNRIRAMVQDRPDWCVSRQRAWGVPITVFADKKTGRPLRDRKVLDRIVAAVEAEGADAWFASDPARFLAPERDPADYEQVKDILDVWFDSGATHSFVLEARAELGSPADLYLEGSDQHRGWFQSSLLESCGTRGRAPYKGVLTHGFVLDEHGRKMSKSLGNVTSPQDAVKDHGADVLRLWVALSDYREDLRIGPEILKQHADYYRRLRNTLRYLLGALDGFSAEERIEAKDMPELERWVLHRLWELDRLMRDCFARYDFHPFYRALHDFCAADLSAFYFDVRKDSLYCDRPDALRRRAARTVLDLLFGRLVRWLAPVLCFTAEEAWLMRHPERESIHLQLFEGVSEDWYDDVLAAKWAAIRDVRRVITGALERDRAEKKIGSSLQADPAVYVTAEQAAAFAGIDVAEIAITSAASLVVAPPPPDAFTLPDIVACGVVIGLAEGLRCERCWRVLPEVGQGTIEPDLCGRCGDAVVKHPLDQLR